MALILNIETSTRVCSVGLAKDGEIVAIRESNRDKTHAVNLSLFMMDVMKEYGVSVEQLDAVAVSEGPGSYTGLRIGISAAKGLAYGSNKPLIAVSTLQAMALNVSSRNEHPDAYFCPMLDARRMEVYTAIFNQNNEQQELVSAKIIDENSFMEQLETKKLVFFGDGAAKCQPVLQHKNAIFVDGIEPTTQFMAPLAEAAFEQQKFEDVAYFEPFYLKDFKVTTSKKNIFR